MIWRFLTVVMMRVKCNEGGNFMDNEKMKIICKMMTIGL